MSSSLEGLRTVWLLPKSRWMLGTKELTKNMNMTTARTDTHFTKRTLSVILCCMGAGERGEVEEKRDEEEEERRKTASFLSHNCLCLSPAVRRRGGRRHY